MKDLLRRLQPQWLRQWRAVRRERIELQSLAPIPCDTSQLSRSLSAPELRALLKSSVAAGEWPEVEDEISAFQISESADGVNPGDRRAIFHILRGLGVKSMLEIGTHVGASTVYAAAALARNCANGAGSPRFTTVDLIEVNDGGGPWRQRGSHHSPKEMASRLGVGEWVRFVTSPSLEFLRSGEDRFDFVFLDGDHTASTVYQEIPAALRLLTRRGVILLHDCFPDLRPLWSNGIVIPGPWLAVGRLRSEGALIDVLPFGELPWPTKLDSCISSLALVVGAWR